MKLIVRDNHIILENVVDFSVAQTLECGQCFHFEKLDENEYAVVAKKKLLRIKQTKKEVIFYDTTLEEYNTIWKEYFDLERNYEEIKNVLLCKDELLKEAIQAKNGVRILNQDFFEIMISFIISQNKQIPHIKQIVRELSKHYGNYLGKAEGKEFYSFPDVEQLGKVTEEEFRACKTGFRAPYLVDACEKVRSGVLTETMLKQLNSEQALKKLLEVKGIGEKVGNCILLFGLSRREAFPIDVWVKRIMERLYFQEETKKEIIMKFALEHFKEYGGYAQQYLFYFARDTRVKENS